MPIRPYLGNHNFDSETVRTLGVAFEITVAGLKIGPLNEPARALIADKLIEFCVHGETRPQCTRRARDRFCPNALNLLRAVVKKAPADNRPGRSFCRGGYRGVRSPARTIAAR
jgi:hypothetical protein